ncbi:hypothetical protein ACFX2I_008973 [Malus domestica]
MSPRRRVLLMKRESSWIGYVIMSQRSRLLVLNFMTKKIDVVMKKHALLSSQSTSSQYSSETTKNLCKKPNEGGPLICNTGNCSVVVHENWLSSSAILYKNDNFKCPFCSYTLDLTEYLDSKKRASMLKKDLDAFIHSLEHQPEECLGSQHNKENICMRKFHEDLNSKTKGHQNGHLGKSVEHLEKQCEERANEINDLQLQNITGLDGCQNQVPAKGDTLSSKSAVSLLADKRQAVVIEQEDLQRHITNAQEVQGHALNIDSEQAGARMSSTSNYSASPDKGGGGGRQVVDSRHSMITSNPYENESRTKSR